jgi:hypothetical protein
MRRIIALAGVTAALLLVLAPVASAAPFHAHGSGTAIIISSPVDTILNGLGSLHGTGLGNQDLTLQLVGPPSFTGCTSIDMLSGGAIISRNGVIDGQMTFDGTLCQTGPGSYEFTGSYTMTVGDVPSPHFSIKTSSGDAVISFAGDTFTIDMDGTIG